MTQLHIIELRQHETFAGQWQVSCDGTLIACSLDRRGAIDATAGLFRRQLRDADYSERYSLVGFDLPELLSSRVLNPNWRRKGPAVDPELFEQAEAYLQTELVPAEEAELFIQYRAALTDWNFRSALSLLKELGERQACSSAFWRLLERLAVGAWAGPPPLDRRLEGRTQTALSDIKRRARGQADLSAVPEHNGKRTRARKRYRDHSD